MKRKASREKCKTFTTQTLCLSLISRFFGASKTEPELPERKRGLFF